MTETAMSYNEARDAILAILDRVPTHALPEGRIEHYNGKTILWFGGHGRHLGSARRGDERDPSIYHRDAAATALELEAVYRADLAHESGDPDHA